MAENVPKVTLSNGQIIPALGLGTWKSQPGEVSSAVKDAIDVGYRHFDCAYVYGNEKEVGEAIQSKIDEGVVKREDLYITSKLWNTFHRPDLVEGAVKQSLDNLGLNYLDLYLIHFPFGFQEEGELYPKGPDGKLAFSDVDYLDTWKAMEELVRKGFVKSIGISNFNSKQVERLLEVASIKPVVNQVECHPYLNQSRLQAFCEARGIKLVAYSPLGSADRPQARAGEPKLLEDPKLLAIANRYERTPAQILIRYQIDIGNIVIPKSVTKSRIESNFKVFDFALASDDLQLLDTFNCNKRYLEMTMAFGHKYHPFENEEF